MATTTALVAFRPRRSSAEWPLWVIGALTLVSAAMLSAAAAPTVARAQFWTFASTPPSAIAPASEVATASENTDLLATTVPVEANTAATAQRAGTPAGPGDVAFSSALAGVLAPVATGDSANPEDTPPAAAPVTQPATPAATPLATPVATVVPPAATPVVAATSAAVVPARPPDAILDGYSARARGLFLAMNVERVAAGLPPLAVSAPATEVAMLRALDMQEQNYFAHVSPSGETWLHLVNRAGIALTAGGENLAKIGGDVDHSVTVAITKLMESPTHAANILSPHYDHMGVAALTDDSGVTVFVTIFIGN